MRVRVFPKTLRVEIENETRVFPESLIFETEMRVSQKSDSHEKLQITATCHFVFLFYPSLKKSIYYDFVAE